MAAIHALICNAADHRPRYTAHLGSELAATVQTGDNDGANHTSMRRTAARPA